MSQPFSFTCVICIEQFDKEERYPVVLPCGHTYLCHQCAQRLDKCTECRAPLTEEIPQPSQVSSSCRKHPRTSQPVNFRMSQMYGGSSSRSLSSVTRDFNRQATTSQVDSPQPQIVKKRLPLPKNLVLLSLMEAQSSTIPSTSESEDQPVNSKGLPVEPSKKENKVNSCGSYTVKAPEGLQVFRIKPADATSNYGNEDMDADSLVSSFFVDYCQLLEAEEGDKNFLPPDLLQYGDTVQVSWIDKDGWAKLARGYGYVQACNGDLVKVGEPKDVSCKLEGMIHSLATEKSQVLSKFTQEKNEFDYKQEVIAKKLRRALIETEDQTVVTNEEGSASNVVQVLTFEDSISSFIEVFDAEKNGDWHDSKPEILRYDDRTDSVSVMDSDIESDSDTDAGNAVEDLQQQEIGSQVFRPVASSPSNASQSLSRCNADDESESNDAKELPAPSTPKKQIIDSNIRSVNFRALSSHSGLHSARNTRKSQLNRSTSDDYRKALSYSSLSNHSGLSRTRASGRQPRRFSVHF
mmetsp:Transcript_10868/g.16768  ORF Transcript_10868/g.16768 Transcript_10868/m.16768 type:complete len:521 (-) Transcript_10868:129-1691(-)